MPTYSKFSKNSIYSIYMSTFPDALYLKPIFYKKTALLTTLRCFSYYIICLQKNCQIILKWGRVDFRDHLTNSNGLIGIKF